MGWLASLAAPSWLAPLIGDGPRRCHHSDRVDAGLRSVRSAVDMNLVEVCTSNTAQLDIIEADQRAHRAIMAMVRDMRGEDDASGKE